jgi:aminoglycoside phosphotransferase (APT) family kinase protein
MDASVEGIWPERLGRFLYDLHLVPPEFVGMRLRSAATVRAEYRLELAELGRHVLPLLGSSERAYAERLIDGFLDDDANFRFASCLTHGDIGPTHVLITDRGDLSGVIDWGDASIGDPAADLAWVLHAMPVVGERVLAAYGGPPDDRFVVRGRFRFTMMPWYEAHYGVETDQPAFVESGLEGVRERLG